MSKSDPLPVAIIDNLEYIKPLSVTGGPRGKVPSHINVDGAEKDYVLAVAFLCEYRGSPATFNAYRREIERLLQWSWLKVNLSVTELRREHISDFIDFCVDPPLSWIGEHKAPRFVERDGMRVANEKWRPFVAIQKSPEGKPALPKIAPEHNAAPESKAPKKPERGVSNSTIKAVYATLQSFYQFLLQESAITANPVGLMRQKSKHIKTQQEPDRVRRIDNEHWEYLIKTTEALSAENPEKHERSLFIISCLLGMYLRISELVADERSTPMMTDFYVEDKMWWFRTIGKGNKERSIAVSDAMLNALKRYRLFRNLTELPLIGQQDVLIPKILGRGPVTSTKQIREIVQACFDAAYDRMRAEKGEIAAHKLRVATVHWLRHTGISEDMKVRPREHVRDDAGHVSVQTTDRYTHTDRKERHESGRAKRIRHLGPAPE